MNNPFSTLSRNKSAETKVLAILPKAFKPEYSAKQIALINPFSLPSNDPDLYHWRENERVEEVKHRQAITGVPLQMRHALNQPRSILPDMRKDLTESEGILPPVISRRNLSSKKETIKEFIQRKREILLVKKNIENKKSKYNELEEDIIKKEDKHKADIKKLEDNKGRVAKYEEQLKLDADNKAKLADDKANDRNEKQKELKDLQEKIESLKAIVDKTVDDLKNLEDYKQFVDELIPNDNKTISDISNTFLTENVDLIDLFAKKLEEGINSLETTNLFQIQQAQEDEQELEILRHRNFLIKVQEREKSTRMRATVNNLEIQKKALDEKLKKIQDAEELQTPVDESNSWRVHNELISLFKACGGDPDNVPKELEILEHIEKAFDKYLKENEKKNKDSLKKKEREIDRERRTKKIEEERIKNIKKSEEMNKKIELRKQKVAKKIGRKDMKRSKLVEKIEVEKLPDEPQEIVDRREFLEMDN